MFLTFFLFFTISVCHPARDEDGRESDAGALDAQEVLGEGPADQGPRSGSAATGGRAHHSSHVGVPLKITKAFCFGSERERFGIW